MTLTYDIPWYVILAVVILAWWLVRKLMAPKNSEIEEWKKRDPLILDVRTPDEFARGSVPGAINIPVQELESNLPEEGRPILCFCLSGGRSGTATSILKSKGYEVLNVGSFGNAKKHLG